MFINSGFLKMLSDDVKGKFYSSRKSVYVNVKKQEKYFKIEVGVIFVGGANFSAGVFIKLYFDHL